MLSKMAAFQKELNERDQFRIEGIEMACCLVLPGKAKVGGKKKEKKKDVAHCQQLVVEDLHLCRLKSTGSLK